MADLSRFIRRREILKVVDPSPGFPPGAIPTEEPEQEQIESQIEETSPRQQVEDLILLQEEIYSMARSAVEEIVSENGPDHLMDEYRTAVEERTFDARLLLTNRGVRPRVPSFTLTKVKALERRVFQEVADPRAAHLRQLYQLGDLSAVSGLVLQQIWRDIDNWTQLPVSKLALAAEARVLKRQRAQIRRIHGMRSGKVSRSFVENLLAPFRAELTFSEPKEMRKLQEKLSNIRDMLKIAQFVQLQDWETLQENLLKTVGDSYKLAAQRVLREQYYLISGRAQEMVLGLEDQLGAHNLDLAGDLVPEIGEFTKQLRQGAGHVLSRIEDDLMERERSLLLQERARLDSLKIAVKSDFNSQFVELLETAISVLSAYRLGTDKQYAYENLVEALTRRIDELPRRGRRTNIRAMDR